MRFVRTSSLLMAASLTAMLTPPAAAQTFPRAKVQADTQAVPRNPSELRRQSAGSKDAPFVPAGLYAQRVANRLGHISAVIGSEDGSLYALSQSDGTLFHLIDRAFDGRFEMQRPLATGFQSPTGLARLDGDLFISDATAIWRVDIETGSKSKFVSLAQVKAAPDRPLLIFEGRLLLGVSKESGRSSVISVDAVSGIATHLTDLPESPIRGLSYGGGQLWAAVGTSLRPIETASDTPTAKVYPLEAGSSALAVHLPSDSTQWPDDWPTQMTDYVLAVQGPSFKRPSQKQSGGNNIVALPTQFGAPSADLSVLVGGMTGRDGQSAWAAPTAIWIDARGLFFTDRLSGALWRVSRDDRPAPKPRKKISDPLAVPVQKPSLKPNETPAMAGSLIGEASSMGAASTLKVGSFLKQQHDEKEAAELAAKEAEEKQKSDTKALARNARKQELSAEPRE